MSDPLLDALIAKWPSLSAGRREAIMFLLMSSIEPGSKAWEDFGDGARAESATAAILKHFARPPAQP